MIELTGYQILDRIYSGTRTIVYRGTRLCDRTPVTIKVLRNEYPSFSELLHFRNQYAIAKNLSFPGIIQTYSLESCRNGYALIVEDFGGISLKQWTGQGQTVPTLIEFFQIAIALCNTLNVLYRHRIIHKDIKPANILINPQTKEVKLIDFSIASLLPRETQILMSPNVLEGTLGYLSPEQTGRMNRGVDYRTDFYSLGVTFYELLAGELPFQSNDPLELVHSHIAKQPPLLHHINPQIPQVLSSIVSKLMAKNAEDRYQSALGLKFDLEFCLHQLEESGTIQGFAIANRDVCDRFIIPEKLYGREAEVAQLLAAFVRVASPQENRISGSQRLGEKQFHRELMLVAGFSGIGKTAIVNEIHKPIVGARGYFIKGKFDQFNRNIPLGAFVQAFRALMGQLLSESDPELAGWKTKLLAALGDSAQVIIDVIPELEKIIGQQQTATELSGTAAQNRFNLLLPKFLQVFTTKEHPLVIFLDDLQWADSASLKLMQLLMSESDSGYLLLIGAYRDNEVSAAHPLMLALDEIRKAPATINTIRLTALAETSLNQLVAETLSCAPAIAQPLTQLIYQKTKGNPFFSTQFLKLLHDDKLIQFDPPQSPLSKGGRQGGWHCDIAQVKKLALTDDVVEFMALQLQKMPDSTQNLLKKAACIGNSFDLETLATVTEELSTETATNLWKALQEGLILPTSEVYKFYLGRVREDAPPTSEIVSYKFLHDRVQQAAYSLIPENQKQATHLQIGQLLLQHTPAPERDEKIFEIVNQLNYGVDLLVGADKQQQLAELNLAAGHKARASTAYVAASKYATVGLALLKADCWKTQYQLTLKLHTLAAETAYLAEDLAAMEQLVQIILAEAKTAVQQVKAYEVKIQACAARNQAQEAVNLALGLLKMFGVEFPEQPNPSDFQREFQQISVKLGNQSIEDLINLPQMTEAEPLAAMRMLSNLIPLAFTVTPALFPLVTLKQIDLSLKYGNAADSAFGYANYGLIVCGMLGDIETGYQFGELAMSLASKFQNPEMTVKVLLPVASSIKPWKEHTREHLKILLETYTLGLETGDLEFAAYALAEYCNTAYFRGYNLVDLGPEIAQYNHVLRQIKQERVLYCNLIVEQAVLNLLGESANPCVLSGAAYNAEKMLGIHRRSSDLFAFLEFYRYQLQLCYLLGEYGAALENAVQVEQYLMVAVSKVRIPSFYFYDSLTRLAIYPNAEAADQLQILERISANQEKMQHWANHAPMNFLHKLCLVDAEKHRVLNQKMEAIEMFDRAIQLAKANDYIQEEALANELAAKFYLDWDKEKIAETYMQQAYYCYARWGAKAKTDDLETRYPQLLLPILQPQREIPLLGETRFQIDRPSLSDRTIQTISSSSSISESLDFATIFKALQALSSQIKLEQLLSTLLQVVMENAGAKKAALLLLKDGNLTVEAVANLNESITLLSVPLATSECLPLTVIDYVKRTLKTVVLDDATAGTDFMADSYLVQQQPKSVLCAPILYQGRLIGLLYLENQLTIGAFTRDRLQVVQLLCAQAAISLENARLYQQSQDYAQQLERSLADLQQAQLQTIQNEKMATLGNLVAGVAHEINNPIGFITASVNNAEEYIQDLLAHIQCYQENHPEPTPQVIDHAEDIDLEFLIEDLQKLIPSMKVASQRIREISTTLRTFSRADTPTKVACNLHEGIDSTLLILKYRLKANDKRPAIEIVKHYGNLPLVNCFFGQLNQVFMNIIANAIDALDAACVGQSFAQLQAKPGRIMICTEMSIDLQTVSIRIKDNGPGMLDSVKSRIFDHLFTTKEVGKGTGLGLAIARQIVQETHGGTLYVESTLGKGTEFIIRIPI
ncbi:ATP-binding sensor histidine kinase [Microcoleus sp. bin38.metabat.b11b12b14.051]|uniref:trifunctional serine/threonine-protein kinase/ATP-binding protein/sensor histidine kinase n=1 Tax=Microcoleus sp. bin38.metabat.b11b12b14.051 TaxID=2742709 RepID=UPI0025FC3845|nr:ATP-binding sensor histidine kinase [Microcoleus sp. bin38.metabat.b11b12b14.051]